MHKDVRCAAQRYLLIKLSWYPKLILLGFYKGSTEMYQISFEKVDIVSCRVGCDIDTGKIL